MAQECSESSVAISSVAPPGSGWWDLHHHHATSCWNNNDSVHNNGWHQQNPNSNSSCEEDVSMSTSFTNGSNHSGLTVESTRRLVEPQHASDTQLWSQILLGVGGNGELQNNQEVGENFLDALSSKSISSNIFEPPACDYLNNFYKHINGFATNHSQHQHQGLMEHERVTKLSNSLNTWSIAPPDPGLVSNSTFDPVTCNVSLNRNVGFLSSYGHSMKVENDVENSGGYMMRRPYGNNGVGYNMGSSVVADNNKYFYGVDNSDNNSSRNFNFNLKVNKPLIDVQSTKSSFRSLSLTDCRKQGLQTSLKIGRGGQGNITSEGKKKKSEDNSEMTVLKKPKHDSSTASSSVKMQAPKVKLGDRITALQQIVSPFGKTDTASVLLEAIQYIKFLQEQVQLLSNPYMKNNAHKDPWVVGLEKKDTKVDLKSRGLCLVPVSCTPQVYHENTGSDYWTPTYRGCLYR